MKKIKLFLMLAVFAAAAPAFAEVSAQTILSKADEIRMPTGNYAIHATVVSVKPSGQKQSADYEVWLKGTEKTLIKTLSPAMDRGTSILMLGYDLWVFLPNVSKPIRISLQQRLLGEVSNGDLARTNFVGDYKPTRVETKRTVYVLDLKAKSEDVTYGSIRLWVDKATYRPLKAAFYAFSGRLLKVGSYEDYRPLAGIVRPSRLVFEDAVVHGQISTIYYTEMTPRSDLADKYFTKDYLKKLKY